MAIKSLFLSVVVTVVVSFCSTSAEIPNFSSAICLAEKAITGVECTKCDFLTFGQDKVVPGISHFCPMTNLEEKYCCYGPSRDPYCCDVTEHFVNGLVWIVAVIAVIAVVCGIIKCVISA